MNLEAPILTHLKPKRRHLMPMSTEGFGLELVEQEFASIYHEVTIQSRFVVEKFQDKLLYKVEELRRLLDKYKESKLEPPKYIELRASALLTEIILLYSEYDDYSLKEPSTEEEEDYMYM